MVENKQYIWFKLCVANFSLIVVVIVVVVASAVSISLSVAKKNKPCEIGIFIHQRRGMVDLYHIILHFICYIRYSYTIRTCSSLNYSILAYKFYSINAFRLNSVTILEHKQNGQGQKTSHGLSIHFQATCSYAHRHRHMVESLIGFRNDYVRLELISVWMSKGGGGGAHIWPLP